MAKKSFVLAPGEWGGVGLSRELEQCVSWGYGVSLMKAVELFEGITWNMCTELIDAHACDLNFSGRPTGGGNLKLSWFL